MGLLYHVSEEPGIVRFEPRPPVSAGPGPAEPVVWAVDEARLVNYLLPRDCPRVFYYALPDSNLADVARLLGDSSARHVIAVESGWLDRIRAGRLYLYHLPPPTFAAFGDVGAGYHVSREPVEPTSVTRVDDLLAANPRPRRRIALHACALAAARACRRLDAAVLLHPAAQRAGAGVGGHHQAPGRRRSARAEVGIGRRSEPSHPLGSCPRSD
jgi:hypothetical protein